MKYIIICYDKYTGYHRFVGDGWVRSTWDSVGEMESGFSFLEESEAEIFIKVSIDDFWEARAMGWMNMVSY